MTPTILVTLIAVMGAVVAGALLAPSGRLAAPVKFCSQWRYGGPPGASRS